MSRNPFGNVGWNLPPGVTPRMIDDAQRSDDCCAVCGEVFAAEFDAEGEPTYDPHARDPEHVEECRRCAEEGDRAEAHAEDDWRREED